MILEIFPLLSVNMTPGPDAEESFMVLEIFPLPSAGKLFLISK